MLWDNFNIGFWNVRPVHSGLTVNIRCIPGGLNQWSAHPPGNWDITDMCQRTNLQCVVSGFLKRLIARDSGNGKQVNLRTMCGQQNSYGVIMPRVAVENNFVFHSLCLQYPKAVLLQLFLSTRRTVLFYSNI